MGHNLCAGLEQVGRKLTIHKKPECSWGTIYVQVLSKCKENLQYTKSQTALEAHSSTGELQGRRSTTCIWSCSADSQCLWCPAMNPCKTRAWSRVTSPRNPSQMQQRCVGITQTDRDIWSSWGSDHQLLEQCLLKYIQLPSVLISALVLRSVLHFVQSLAKWLLVIDLNSSSTCNSGSLDLEK